MFEHVGIVGVGLIGASIGLALKERGLARRIIGVGHRQQSLDAAIERGAIDEAYTRIGPELAPADLVIICTPVHLIPEQIALARIVVSPRAIITDAGSVKARVVQEASAGASGDGPQAEFLGSHPLAGSHRHGPEAAYADLFEGRTCVVTPTSQSSPGAVEKLQDFWQRLGMTVTLMDAEEHDAILARVSHLPHVASFALALAAHDGDLALAATGFRDTTRLAASRPDIWTSIFRENRQAVLEAIDDYLDRVRAIRDAIDALDQDRMEKLLADANKIRRSLGD